MLRIGRVSSVDEESFSAKVTFEDREDTVSYDMQILVQGAASTKSYWLPVPGEMAVCLLIPEGRGQGIIIGTLYNEADGLPPVTDASKRYLSFPDGTTLDYDYSTSTLTINAAGAVNIVASGNVNVTGDVIADGVSLKNHTHSGVEPGTASTDPPEGGGA